MFESMYDPDDRDREIFGSLYSPPDRFRHGEWEKVAEIAKPEDSDGNPVTIYECRLPARFFKLVAHPSENTIGKPQPGFSLSTGSGDEMGELIVSMAKAIAGGMLDIDREEGAAGQEEVEP